MKQTRDERIAEINAHKVPCRYCGAKADQPCHNRITKTELRGFAAHQCRIDDAKKTIIFRRIIDEDDEVIF